MFFFFIIILFYFIFKYIFHIEYNFFFHILFYNFYRQKLIEWQEHYADLAEEDIVQLSKSKYQDFLNHRGMIGSIHQQLNTNFADVKVNYDRINTVNDVEQFDLLSGKYFYNLSLLKDDTLDDLRSLHLQRENGAGKWWRSQIDELRSEFTFNLIASKDDIMEPAEMELSDLIKLSNQAWTSFVNAPNAKQYRKKYIDANNNNSDKKDLDETNFKKNIEVSNASTGTVFGTGAIVGKSENDVVQQRKEKRDYKKLLEEQIAENNNANSSDDEDDYSDSSVDTIDELMQEFREEDAEKRLQKNSKSINRFET